MYSPFLPPLSSQRSSYHTPSSCFSLGVQTVGDSRPEPRRTRVWGAGAESRPWGTDAGDEGGRRAPRASPRARQAGHRVMRLKKGFWPWRWRVGLYFLGACCCWSCRLGGAGHVPICLLAIPTPPVTTLPSCLRFATGLCHPHDRLLALYSRKRFAPSESGSPHFYPENQDPIMTLDPVEPVLIDGDSQPAWTVTAVASQLVSTTSSNSSCSDLVVHTD